MSNPHFNNFLFPNDAQIIEDLTSDFIYDHGIGVKYLPREDVKFDPVMNEPVVSSFNTGHDVDIFVEESSGQYMGPNALFDFAGFSYGKDNVTIHFDRRKFVAIVGKVPREGDLIHVRELDRTFEIIDVDKADPMISGGREFSIPATMRIYGAGEGTTKFGADLLQNLESNSLESILTALEPDRNLEPQLLVDENDEPILDGDGLPQFVDPTEEEINEEQSANDPQVQNDRLKDSEPGTPKKDRNSNPFGFT